MLEVDLFEKIDDNQILELLQCIGIKTKTVKKHGFLLKTGNPVDSLGVILSGCAEVFKTDYAGNVILIDKLFVNDIFGHNVVCLNKSISPVDIVAKDKCEVLLIPFDKVVTPCQKVCKYHLQLIKNVMKMISKKNSILNEKIDVIGQKTIRSKILALLQNYKKEGEVFTIPFSREEMAKFLCTDRSAMSRELCKMRDEGIIRFYKNNFEILK